MKFRSTRKKANPLPFSDALKMGLAPDGGLYVPENFPAVPVTALKPPYDFQKMATTVLGPFLKDDRLAEGLGDICARAFDFPCPLETLDDHTAVLELFHGPTAAFKDFGARFLAESLKALGGDRQWTILVATSGDTGGAVASAFHGHPRFEVFILYPKGLVSPFQEMQLTCWGGNVHAFRVSGNFDDCQRLAKAAFEDSWWKQNKNLTSANSINIGRILPQTVYYAMASMNYRAKTGRTPGVIVPSGNLGNGLAALWAKKLGFPIEKVILACNANQAVPDYFKTGVWKAAPTVSTLANAMDVGNASNMERILDLYPALPELKRVADSFSVSDEEIREGVKLGKKKWNRIWCPHTATAAFVRNKMTQGDWIIVATAHASKFMSVVEPLIGEKIPLPPSLERITRRPRHFKEIGATSEALRQAVMTLKG